MNFDLSNVCESFVSDGILTDRGRKAIKDFIDKKDNPSKTLDKAWVRCDEGIVGIDRKMSCTLITSPILFTCGDLAYTQNGSVYRFNERKPDDELYEEFKEIFTQDDVGRLRQKFVQAVANSRKLPDDIKNKAIDILLKYEAIDVIAVDVLAEEGLITSTEYIDLIIMAPLVKKEEPVSSKEVDFYGNDLDMKTIDRKQLVNNGVGKPGIKKLHAETKKKCSISKRTNKRL